MAGMFGDEGDRIERLALLPHPRGMLASEGRGSVASPGVDWKDWIAPQWLAALSQAVQAPRAAYAGADMDERDALNIGLGMLGTNAAVAPLMGRAAPGTLGVNVFHGSPHKFDAFDASKIGTGEGAQAYGHGLYFAENPKVAGSYTSFGNWGARASGRTPPTLFRGEPVQFNGVGNAVGDFNPALGRFLTRVNTHGTYDLALEQAEGTLREMVRGGIFPSEQRLLAAEIAAAKENKHLIQGAGKVGNLYKADLPDAMIPKMLDWDKPLSQQPSGVAETLVKLRAELGYKPDASSKTAGDFYKRLEKAAGTGWLISNELSRAGVPGIRYLDQGSRAGGAGTSNYVVFPGMEKNVKILERK
jgi:hypothetical protein